MKDWVELFMLGIKISKTYIGMELSQSYYIGNIWKKFGQFDFSPM